MTIEIKPFITTVIVIMALFSACAAIEYKTMDTQYYKVEYPTDWKIYEHITEEHTETVSSGSEVGVSVNVGSNGVRVYLTLDSKKEGLFNEDGTLNDSTAHFFETFQVKKNATTNVTAAPEYKVYENKFFKVEYPVNYWMVYPNEKQLAYNFQFSTNGSWNVECFDPVEVNLRLDGVKIYIQATKDTGSFINDGFVDKSLIHFLKTFKLKSLPTPVL